MLGRVPSGVGVLLQGDQGVSAPWRHGLLDRPRPGPRHRVRDDGSGRPPGEHEARGHERVGAEDLDAVLTGVEPYGGRATRLSRHGAAAVQLGRAGRHRRLHDAAVDGDRRPGPARVANRSIGQRDRQVGNADHAQLADPDRKRRAGRREVEAGRRLGLVHSHGELVGADRREADPAIDDPRPDAPARPEDRHHPREPRGCVRRQGEVQPGDLALPEPAHPQRRSQVRQGRRPGAARITVHRGERGGAGVRAAGRGAGHADGLVAQEQGSQGVPRPAAHLQPGVEDPRLGKGDQAPETGRLLGGDRTAAHAAHVAVDLRAPGTPVRHVAQHDVVRVPPRLGQRRQHQRAVDRQPAAPPPPRAPTGARRAPTRPRRVASWRPGRRPGPPGWHRRGS